MTAKHLARGLLPVDVFALTVDAEARGEGRDGMLAVACAIRNRADRRKQTVQDVCLARKAFSCWNPGDDANHRRLVEYANLIRLGQTPRELQPAYDIARAVLTGSVEDHSRGGDHYYNPKGVPGGRPYWHLEGVEPCLVLGNHVFLALEGNQ